MSTCRTPPNHAPNRTSVLTAVAVVRSGQCQWSAQCTVLVRKLDLEGGVSPTRRALGTCELLRGAACGTAVRVHLPSWSAASRRCQLPPCASLANVIKKLPHLRRRRLRRRVLAHHGKSLAQRAGHRCRGPCNMAMARAPGYPHAHLNTWMLHATCIPHPKRLTTHERSVSEEALARPASARLASASRL